MQNKLKKLLKFGFTLFTISLLLTNCEKDVIEEKSQQVAESNLALIEDININQIPKVKSFLNKNPISKKSIFSKNSTSKTDETDFGTVDFSRIKKLTDSLGQVTYTFGMKKLEGLGGNYFDNLVISLGEEEGTYTANIL